MTDCVNDLIGPNLSSIIQRLIPLPGGNTEVKWHQDFTFTPHTNDDVIAFMVDDAMLENGPLEVAPDPIGDRIPVAQRGFHRRCDDQVAADARASSSICMGAGSVCLMHTRLMHGSKANHQCVLAPHLRLFECRCRSMFSKSNA